MNEVETKESSYAKVKRLQEELLKGEAVDLPITNYFSEGVYARQMFIAKGYVVVGKMHRYRNLNIVSKGKISVLTEDGVVTLTAPATIVSEPGTKRAVYAHEDTVWTTIHGTHETDVDKIEATFIVPEAEEEAFLLSVQQLSLEGK